MLDVSSVRNTVNQVTSVKLSFSLIQHFVVFYAHRKIFLQHISWADITSSQYASFHQKQTYSPLTPAAVKQSSWPLKMKCDVL